MPDAVGVPLMVMVLDAHAALTPAVKLFAPDMPSFAMPVAPVVAMVMLVSVVLMQSFGAEDGAPAVLSAVTVIVPVAFILPQPPVNGML